MGQTLCILAEPHSMIYMDCKEHTLSIRNYLGTIAVFADNWQPISPCHILTGFQNLHANDKCWFKQFPMSKAFSIKGYAVNAEALWKGAHVEMDVTN